MKTEEQKFVDDPMKVLIFAGAVLAGLWFVAAIVIPMFGPPMPNSKFARMGITTNTGVVIFLGVTAAIVFAIVALIISFFPKVQTTCRSDGFTVQSESLWSSAPEVRNFAWTEVDNHEVKSGPKNSQRFVVLIRNEEIVLMNRTIFNKNDFLALETAFDKNTRKIRS